MVLMRSRSVATPTENGVMGCATDIGAWNWTASDYFKLAGLVYKAMTNDDASPTWVIPSSTFWTGSTLWPSANIKVRAVYRISLLFGFAGTHGSTS